jgi:hypothetical protein
MKSVIILFLLSTIAFPCSKTNITLNGISPIDNSTPFEVKIEAYLADNKTIQNIILPPIGGTTLLESKYARKICARGVSSYIFVNWTNDYEESVIDLKVHRRAIERALYSIKLFLEKNDMPTSILGTSLGGIYAGLAVGRFSQLTKAAIITSGMDLAGILAYGMLPETIEQRNKRFEKLGFKDQDEYYLALTNAIDYDYESYSRYYRNKELLHFRSFNDIVIPVLYQDQLISYFDEDLVRVNSIRFNHRNTIIWTYARRSNWIANFLTRF